MYLLDTNVVSELRRPKPHGAVLSWIAGVPADDLFLSAVTIGEIQAGIELTRDRDAAKAETIERWLDQVSASYNVVPMDAAAFRAWARLKHRKSDTLIEDAMIDSFCHHAGETIAIELSNEAVRSVQPEGMIVYLALPAARWWQGIIHACSNTMVFFSSRDRLETWLGLKNIERPGEALTIEQAIELSRPIYARKFEPDYERPSPAELQRCFETMGLTGPFWELS